MDLRDAPAWIRARVAPTGDIETAHDRPWSTVWRVPVADGIVWFKACGAVQAFEPRLTADLCVRWPDLMPEVLDHDVDRAWLLLRDAGTQVRELGNPPELWLAALPRYAELQRGEIVHAAHHLAHGVPDLRVTALPTRYGELLRRDVPIAPSDVDRLRRFEGAFALLCEELAGHGIPDTIQHDDLHMNNLFVEGDRVRVLDWGDASISHPFVSLVVTLQFLQERNGLAPGDPWFARLRDAYLEPWGRDLVPTFELAQRVGAFAHAIAWLRQRDHLTVSDRAEFDQAFTGVLQRAVAYCDC